MNFSNRGILDRNGSIRDAVRVKAKANDPIGVKEKFIYAKVR